MYCSCEINSCQKVTRFPLLQRWFDCWCQHVWWQWLQGQKGSIFPDLGYISRFPADHQSQSMQHRRQCQVCVVCRSLCHYNACTTPEHMLESRKKCTYQLTIFCTRPFPLFLAPTSLFTMWYGYKESIGNSTNTGPAKNKVQHYDDSSKLPLRGLIRMKHKQAFDFRLYLYIDFRSNWLTRSSRLCFLHGLSQHRDYISHFCHCGTVFT